jgi:WD40 repeat protein
VHLHSHSGAVTGLCVSPLENCAVTVSRSAASVATHWRNCLTARQVGEDRTLRFWDLEQRRMEAAFNLGLRCRSVHVSPDGRLYAVGHAAGQFSLWDVASMRCAAKNSFRKEEVDDIRFR